jgi:hypothetical protein
MFYLIEQKILNNEFNLIKLLIYVRPAGTTAAPEQGHRQ